MRYKVKINACKKIIIKKILEKGKVTVNNKLEVEIKDQVTNPNFNLGIDMQIDNWIQNPDPESSNHDYTESKDHTQNY